MVHCRLRRSEVFNSALKRLALLALGVSFLLSQTAHALPLSSASPSASASASPSPSLTPKTMALALAKVLKLKKQLAAKAKKNCKGSLKLLRTSLCDGDFDYLTNQQEMKIRTNLRKWDSDKDGLADGLEVLVFGTNPKKSDTDGDGVLDGNDDANANGVADEDEDDAKGEAPGPEDADDPTSSRECKPDFDALGNTSAYGIPSGLSGSIQRGTERFKASCAACHTVEKGNAFDFAALKTAVAGPPMFIKTLSDQDLADVVAYLHRSHQADVPSCIAKPSASSSPSTSTSPSPSPAACGLDPFDNNDSTTQFGIPSGLVGNILFGQQQFQNTCSGCHATEKGANFEFSRIKSTLAGAPMFITSLSDQQLANLTAYLNRSSQTHGTPCPGSTPLPPPPSPTPTPTPTPTIAPSPTPTICGTSPFDANGSTTQFLIPNGMVGNISAGQQQFNLTCFGCHQADKGTLFDFARLKAAINGAPMNISTLSDQAIANITAYLNRSLAGNVPPCPDTTPLPTPTPTPPLTDYEYGKLIYETRCQSCHTTPRSLERPSASKIRSALVEVRRMQNIKLLDEELRVLVYYLSRF